MFESFLMAQVEDVSVKVLVMFTLLHLKFKQ